MMMMIQKSFGLLLIFVIFAMAIAAPDCKKGAMPCIDMMHPQNHTVYSTLTGHCRHSTNGLRCLDRWTRTCVPHGSLRTRFLDFVRESITGHNDFCDDPTNPQKYSSFANSNCGEIPFPSSINRCGKIFTVRLLLRPDAPDGYCCNRLEYLNCVYRSLRKGCHGENRKFAMKMYETLLSGMTSARSPDLCAHQDRNFVEFCPQHSRGVLSDPIPEPTEEELVHNYFK